MSKPPPLPHLTPNEAIAKGYKAITNPIALEAESHIILSIETSMRRKDAVWIHSGGRTVELARLKTEILTRKTYHQKDAAP